MHVFVRVLARDFVHGQAKASQSVAAARRRRQVGTGTDGFVCCRKSVKSLQEEIANANCKFKGNPRMAIQLNFHCEIRKQARAASIAQLQRKKERERVKIMERKKERYIYRESKREKDS